MTSKPRTASLGVGALAAVLLMSGCQNQSHVGTAAILSSSRITTDSLNTAYTAIVTSDVSPKPTEPQVLETLITNQLLTDLAKSLNVAVPAGDVDAAYAAVTATDAASGTTSTEAQRQLQAQTTATATALEVHYAHNGGTPDSALVVVFPVKDQATANKALAALKDPSTDPLAVGRKYAVTATAVEQGTAQLAALPAAAQRLQPGQSIAVPVNSQLYVLHVIALLDGADLSKALAGEPVTVNPRFGNWDATSFKIVPAVSDVVVLPSATTPEPTASLPPVDSGAAPSAQPSAQPSAAPQVEPSVPASSAAVPSPAPSS